MKEQNVLGSEEGNILMHKYIEGSHHIIVWHDDSRWMDMEEHCIMRFIGNKNASISVSFLYVHITLLLKCILQPFLSRLLRYFQTILRNCWKWSEDLQSIGAVTVAKCELMLKKIWS